MVHCKYISKCHSWNFILPQCTNSINMCNNKVEQRANFIYLYLNNAFERWMCFFFVTNKQGDWKLIPLASPTVHLLNNTLSNNKHAITRTNLFYDYIWLPCCVDINKTYKFTWICQEFNISWVHNKGLRWTQHYTTAAWRQVFLMHQFYCNQV